MKKGQRVRERADFWTTPEIHERYRFGFAISISLYLELYLRRDRTVYAHARRKRGRPRSTTGGARTHGVHKSPGRAGPSPSPWDDTMPRIMPSWYRHTHMDVTTPCVFATMACRVTARHHRSSAPGKAFSHSSTRTPQRSRLFSFSNSMTRTRKHLLPPQPARRSSPRLPLRAICWDHDWLRTPATSKTSRDAGPYAPDRSASAAPPAVTMARHCRSSGAALPLYRTSGLGRWDCLGAMHKPSEYTHERLTSSWAAPLRSGESQARKWHRQRSVRRM